MDIWDELSKVYNMSNVPDEAKSIIGDVMLTVSAQPEPRWIPVSERLRLPNAQTEVIVSCLDDSGDTAFAYTSCGFITPNGEYWIVDNEINSFVIAWKPFPEPYREEGGQE